MLSHKLIRSGFVKINFGVVDFSNNASRKYREEIMHTAFYLLSMKSWNDLKNTETGEHTTQSILTILLKRNILIYIHILIAYW